MAQMAVVGPARTRMFGVALTGAGAFMVVAGAATWAMISRKLADESITVADDARWFAGAKVAGPLTAFSQADIIDHHARGISGGKTYAELAQDDPVRATMMNASFLRASLFTSVLSFGVAAMAVGVGALTTISGRAVLALGKGVRRR
ncbi:aromatic ring-opening dioxygenase LigA [Actinoplanes sp. NPDC026619]|uniref:aromatic ring-opening dioxygenase LigA n=1 Tax=Actinoplanes sp. NPDC026619 TaxID=3155798 RepID=UPI0033EF4E80